MEPYGKLSLKTVVDLTKPPYNAVGDGKTDCTAAFCAAFDFVLEEYYRHFCQALEKTRALPGDNDRISFEIRKCSGKINVPFPEWMPPPHILYLPKGEYLVSDTVTYSSSKYQNILFSLPWLEMNALIRLVGESQAGTVIRLKDHAPGFGFGANRPIISFMNGEKSGVAMTNMVKNLTIHAGQGNAGAVGLRFFANNTGLVEDVSILAGGADRLGHAGLEINAEKVSGLLVNRVTVEGFDYGIRITPQQHVVSMKNIVLKNQHIYGLYHKNTVLSVRRLYSENSVPAVFSTGFSGHLVLLDSELLNGNPIDSAVICEYGHCYWRNLKIGGYETGFKGYYEQFKTEEMPAEYFSEKAFCFDENKPALRFETADLPEPPACKVGAEQCVTVESFGAVGDGKTDDTAAIQRAMNSGAKGVLFDGGRYKITGPVIVPAGIELVDFLFSDFLLSNEMAALQTGIFHLCGTTADVLTLRNVFGWEHLHGLNTFLENRGVGTVVLKNLHTQAMALYTNTVPGGFVFVENCACTAGGVPGSGFELENVLHTEIYAKKIPGFTFAKQTVVADQINPERAEVEICNKGGRLYVFGFKTEEEGTAFQTVNGGMTQVMGGCCCIGHDLPVPLVECVDASCLVTFSTMVNHPNQRFPLVIRDTKNGRTVTVTDDMLTTRAPHSPVVSKYMG